MGTDFFYIFVAVAFFIWSIRSIFYWIYTWQQLPLQDQGYRSLVLSFFSFSSVFTWLGIGAVFISIVYDFPLIVTQGIVFSIVLLKAVVVINDISNNRLKRPELSTRTVFIACIALFLTALIFSLPLTEKYLWILILDRLLFVISIVPIFLITFPGEIYDDLQTKRVEKKLARFKQLTSITIIGSDARDVGYFSAQILRKNKKTIVIDDVYNRVGTIAQQILTHVKEDTRVLLVVFSATHLHSIAEVLRMINPHAVIITEGFPLKKREHLMKVINTILRKNARLFLHTSFYLSAIQYLKKKKRKIFLYDSDEQGDSSIFASDICQTKDALFFSVTLPTKTIEVKVPFIGYHHIRALLPSIIIADHLGMTVKEILKAIHAISGPPYSLVRHRLHSGAVLIDGTKVVLVPHMLEGITYLKFFKHKRVVVLGIEYGLSLQDIKTMGGELSNSCTHLFILGDRYQKPLRKSMRVGGKCVILSQHEQRIIEFVRYDLKYGDAVLFIGPKTERMVESILRSIPTNE